MNTTLQRLRRMPVWTAVIVSVALSGCATPPKPGAERIDADWPDFPAAEPAETVFRLDESASLMLARVEPEGPMARLGHSHVVGGAILSGRIVTGGNAPRAEVVLHAADIEVDRPSWRRAHGLKPELEASAIEGTRANLLGPEVLDVENFPNIDARSVAIRGPGWLPDVELAVRWRGRVQQFKLPVTVRREGNRIEAIGRFDLRHSDFGIQPFSAAGGALRVSDRIEVRFRIVAVAEAADVAIIAGQTKDPGMSK
jgi:hypothetical protein